MADTPDMSIANYLYKVIDGGIDEEWGYRSVLQFFSAEVNPDPTGWWVVELRSSGHTYYFDRDSWYCDMPAKWSSNEIEGLNWIAAQLLSTIIE